MTLHLYNTLTHQKEIFSPIEAGKVRMYTCGPTVYGSAHIGNFRSYIFADILKRALRANSYEVFAVENITDVGHLTDDEDAGEDKVEKSAREQGLKAKDIARMYTAQFLSDSKELNLLEPDVWVHATAHIGEQIAMIEELEDRGFTYQTSDGIYFDTSKSGSYGRLAQLDLTGLQEGVRVKKNPEKRHGTDFALWKFSSATDKRQMEWPSPWGIGFPGWHIECSAMSRRYLGFPFDIHTGGVDHMPVHHTNEIAQNEGVFGGKTVNYWLHNEFITVDGQKMSKSLGNTYTISDIKEKGFSPLAFRYLVLGTHYRQKQNFTWEALESARSALDRLTDFLVNTENVVTESLGLPSDSVTTSTWPEKFLEAINDDLNTPQAFAVVWELVKDTSLSFVDKRKLIFEFDKVLGLDLEQQMVNKKKEIQNIPEEVMELVTRREEARLAKNFQKSDELRNEISKLGFHIEDSDSGPKIKKM